MRGERGESLAFVIIWPALSTFILLMIVHAFIVSTARAEAEAAVSEGLRAVWRSTSAVTPTPDDISGTELMVDAARDAVARVAAGNDGWRWWSPGSSDLCRADAADASCGAVEIYSDWCNDTKPVSGSPGWVRVEITGSVIGPLASIWPGRLDRLHAAAEGPAVLQFTGSPTSGTEANGAEEDAPPWTQPRWAGGLNQFRCA